MANPNHPFGFRGVRHSSGGTDVRLNEYDIASGLAADIFIGDPVASDGAGGITIATPGAAVLGVFKGVRYTAADGSVVFAKYWPTGTTTLGAQAAKAMVHDDPDTIFLVRTSGTIPAAGALLQSAFVIGTGNAVTGYSASVIDDTGTGTDVRILKVVTDAPQPAYNTTTGEVDGHEYSQVGQYALCEVKFSNHLLA